MDQTINTTSIEDVLGDAFMVYALATIIDRAIPSSIDGNKPVQRRILFSMHEMKLYPGSEPAKVQRIAGDTSGRLHPHGDTSVADAIFRLGQDWIMRYPLIIGQGNFGSPDDPPAAARYPEASLTPYGALMMGSDLDKEIIPFRLTYDGRQEEPVYLPSLFPHLLCNGQNGIAVAMTSETVSHNLTEVCQAIKLVARNQMVTIDKIMKVLPGPDLPTGGYILGQQGIKDYFENGTGQIHVQGKAEIKLENGAKAKILVTELPYGVSPGNFIDDIEKLKETKKNDDIDGVENLSDKDGMEIEITLKRGTVPQVVLNNLYKHTKLRTSISIINNFIDENGTPVTLNIKQMIESYIKNRVTVILARSKAELGKCERRIHIVEGLINALGRIEEVIAIIRKATNREEARTKLMKTVKLSEIQANSILDMQLSRLTNTGVRELTEEKATLTNRIKELKEILHSRDKQIDILCSEVDKMSKDLGDERRTIIIDKQPDEIKIEELIQNEKMVIVISKDGYAKRVNYNAYRTQIRGGKGVLTSEEEDETANFFVANTHDELLLFTDLGNYFRINVLEIQQSNRNGKGVNIRKLIQIDKNEEITVALIDHTSDSKKKRFITTCTQKGYIKRSNIEEYQTKRISGVAGLRLEDGDSLMWAAITSANFEFLLSTRKGYSVRFKEELIRESGRVVRGVAGIKLEEKDELISFIAFDPQVNLEIITISESGYGKRTDFNEYRLTARNAKGVKSMNLNAQTGDLVATLPIMADDKLMFLTSKGKTIKIEAKTVRRSSRVTKGVKIISLEDSGDKVVNMTHVVSGEID